MILHLLSSPPGASPGLRAAPILRPLRALLTCSLGPRLWGIAAVAAGSSSSSLSSPPACPRRSWIAPGWGGTSFPLAPFRGVLSLLLREPVVRRDPLVPPHQGTDDSLFSRDWCWDSEQRCSTVRLLPAITQPRGPTLTPSCEYIQEREIPSVAYSVVKVMERHTNFCMQIAYNFLWKIDLILEPNWRGALDHHTP